jgi:hypothetical protein
MSSESGAVQTSEDIRKVNQNQEIIRGWILAARKVSALFTARKEYDV